jgi:hypothetical protein
MAEDGPESAESMKAQRNIIIYLGFSLVKSLRNIYDIEYNWKLALRKVSGTPLSFFSSRCTKCRMIADSDIIISPAWT